MADDDSSPDTGTPAAGDMPPGGAAGNGSPMSPPPGQQQGVLPPQGAGVPMQVKAAGDHAVGMDILRAVAKAMREAIHKLGDSPESHKAAKIYTQLGEMVQMGDQGKEDAVDPMQRVQQAIMARKSSQMGAPGGGGGPPPNVQPQPNSGPIPMAGAMR
jgi:hypothetical protein